MNTPPPVQTTILRILRGALHAGFLLLLAIATTRLLLTPEETTTAATPVCAGLLAVVYLAGAAAGPPHRTPALVWLATITALWGALLIASPDFSWVAFPLFFLHLHLLRGVHSIIAVTTITALVVTAQALHSGGLSLAMLLGPMLGATVAITLAWGYTALHRESEQRRRLIDDLTATRSELATTQHQAGVAAERERLAREIHDTLAQGLSSIVLLLRAAESALPTDLDTTHARLAEARTTASDNLTEARRFVHDLAPAALSGASLAEALQRLCERTGSRTGIDCRFRLDGHTSSLPAGYDIALLRAAQASLANVTHHAHASTAVVTLGFLDTEVTLDIYDDGTGFDPQSLHSRPDGTGFGLPALRERITTLGGRLEVETTPGHGTAVAIRLPCEAGEETPA